MTLVKVDRDSLVEELYMLMSKIPVESTDARDALRKVIEHVIHAPNLEQQTNHARIQTRRC